MPGLLLQALEVEKCGGGESCHLPACKYLLTKAADMSENIFSKQLGLSQGFHGVAHAPSLFSEGLHKQTAS